MSNEILQLAEAMQWAAGPAHPITEIQRRISQRNPLSPWGVWTLIGLIRHLDRQRWVAGLVQYQLQGSGPELAAAGALAHPEGIAQQGVVPGFIDWEYYFHGRGCCITHRVTG